MKKSRLMILAAFVVMALTLVGCASSISGEPMKAQDTYEIVGYSYVFTLDGNKVEVNYVDWYGDEEIKGMEEAFMSMVPKARSAENPVSGTIVVMSKRNLTLDEFASFVEGAKELVYNQIF